MKKYVNEVDQDYKISIRIANNNKIIYYTIFFFSIILCIKFFQIICIIVIMLNIIYFVLNIVNTLCFNRSESERRKTNLSNAFNANLTIKKTKGFYNNKEGPSLKKYVLNTFESTFYTSNILDKELLSNSIKALIEFLICIISMLVVHDKNIITCILQGILSSEILEEYIIYLYYKIKAKDICNEFYMQIVTTKYTKEKEPILLNECINYECLKTSAHYLLPERIFRKYNAELSKEWNNILDEIKKMETNNG